MQASRFPLEYIYLVLVHGLSSITDALLLLRGRSRFGVGIFHSYHYRNGKKRNYNVPGRFFGMGLIGKEKTRQGYEAWISFEDSHCPSITPLLNVTWPANVSILVLLPHGINSNIDSDDLDYLT